MLDALTDIARVTEMDIDGVIGTVRVTVMTREVVKVSSGVSDGEGVGFAVGVFS